MDPEKQRRIASKGGKAAHAKGRAHEWTVEEAREAGRKGGSASHRQSSQEPQESATQPAQAESESTAGENPFTHSEASH
jgi:general stress protein YciG